MHGLCIPLGYPDGSFRSLSPLMHIVIFLTIFLEKILATGQQIPTPWLYPYPGMQTDGTSRSLRSATCSAPDTKMKKRPASRQDLFLRLLTACYKEMPCPCMFVCACLPTKEPGKKRPGRRQGQDLRYPSDSDDSRPLGCLRSYSSGL